MSIVDWVECLDLTNLKVSRLKLNIHDKISLLAISQSLNPRNVGLTWKEIKDMIIDSYSKRMSQK